MSMLRTLRYFLVFVLLVITISSLSANERGRIGDGQEASIQTYPLQGVAAGDVLMVRLVRTRGNLDFFVAIQNAEQRTIASETGNGAHSLEYEYTFEEAGDFTLVVTRNRGELTTGDYVIEYALSRAFQSTPVAQETSVPQIAELNAEAPYVFLGRTYSVRDTITNEDIDDFYYVFLRANQSIALEVRTTEGALNPNLVLLSSEGRPVERGTAVADAVNTTELKYTATESGWYSVGVLRINRDDTESVGTYILDVTY